MTYTRLIKHWLILGCWCLSSSFIAVTLYQSVSYHCLITWLLLPWSPMIKHTATLWTLFIFSLFDLRYPDGSRLLQPWQQYIITVPSVERLCLTFIRVLLVASASATVSHSEIEVSHSSSHFWIATENQSAS